MHAQLNMIEKDCRKCKNSKIATFVVFAKKFK